MFFSQVPGGSCRLVIFAGALIASLTVHAQAPLPIYTDRLVNSFQDWGWATHDYANTSPVHAGADSVSVTIGTAWQGLQIVRSDFDSGPYDSLSFWINGGASGGQQLQVFGLLHIGNSPNTGQQIYFSLGTLQTNSWQQFTIPLSSLGVANKSNFTGFVIQDRIGAVQPTFYLDDIQLNAKAPPSLVNVSVNATQAIRAVESRWFGVNTAIWDGNFDTPQTVSLLNEMGTRILRCPGGSLSDEYHWASNKTLTNTWQWVTSFASFVHVATNASVAAQAFITVNYGTGTPQEAAAWVRHANVTNQYGFKYWEIGNECYGEWETDSNTFPHDPHTYAVRATSYIAQMKAADPAIKIGVVVAGGEGSYSNIYSLNHPAVNPRTGTTNFGWTPILLATLKSLGATPDFVVHHVYPEYTGTESDPLLLQSAVSWARDAADLRQQITDYFGAAGTNIELTCTENNSNSGNQGRQSTSLVNGLYYADSLGQLMKTEFNAFVWWDLRNSTDTSGSFDPLIYGWRTYGDLGMINGLTNRHPTFYAARLMSGLAQPGDSVLDATSDYSLLSAYAVRAVNGALSLLVLNKDTTTNLNGKIAINGFIPGSAATIRSYGIPQDEATRTNAAYALQNIATNTFAGAATNFTFSFPPLSLTLLTLAPVAPGLAVLASGPQAGGQFVFQLQGQPGVRYVIQNSTNLNAWVPVSTNTLTAGALNFTNPVAFGTPMKFWRAVWLP